jgi:hypothetical protein
MPEESDTSWIECQEHGNLSFFGFAISSSLVPLTLYKLFICQEPHFIIEGGDSMVLQNLVFTYKSTWHYNPEHQY